MSQAKVDAHNEEKKNRKKEMQKAKQRKVILWIVLILVLIVIAFWIGFSIYRYYQANKTITPITVNTSAIVDFFDAQ